MDDEDDPFDDPFDNLPSLAVHETTSEDLVSCDAVDVDGGENHFGDRPSAGVPTDSTVTVRIAGKFIRRHDESLVRIKTLRTASGSVWSHQAGVGLGLAESEGGGVRFGFALTAFKTS